MIVLILSILFSLYIGCAVLRDSSEPYTITKSIFRSIVTFVILVGLYTYFTRFI